MFKNPFKRKKKFASPYYGGTNMACQRLSGTAQDEHDEMRDYSHLPSPSAIPAPPRPDGPDWEQRRFELMKMLVAQDRRSVVLGKLRASNRQIVQVCRELADAAIKELQTHSMQSHDKRREERDELVDGRP